MRSSIGRPPKVLIVEDEAIISLDIKRLLSNSGFGVAAVATNSEQAIREIETSAPDLVLMDINLRGSSDGIETALRIRNNFHLPVVFVSAHADKLTLERASATEPFGYIVKPISALSLTSTIEMALHKHRAERQLEEHRAWLATVLQSIPDVVFVTDLAGQIQFLNLAAEHLTGLRQSEALGKPIESVVSLSHGTQNNIASQLADKAEWGAKVPLPKTTLLRSPGSALGIEVEGDVVVSYSAGEPIGVIYTLRDVSLREQEDRILRQEERMQTLGHLASAIARDFSSLHTLLGATCNELSSLANELTGRERTALVDKTDTIYRVNSISTLMAEQLISLNAQPSVRATFVSASGVVASVEPLFNKLRPASLQVDIHLTDESTLVLGHPERLSILLVNVFLNARERLSGAGRIRISTAQAINHRVALVFELEQIGTPAAKPLSFPLQMENPDFSLSIAQALVLAMEGSITFQALSDTQGRIAISLPLQYAEQDVVDAMNRVGTVLLIGSDLTLFGRIEEQLEQFHFGVIRCSSAAEALLLGQFYDNKIDCVVTEAESISPQNRRKLMALFSNRNAATDFIRLSSAQPAEERGWLSFGKSPEISIAHWLMNRGRSDIRVN
jgi:PAS domain S-box-containing protein